MRTPPGANSEPYDEYSDSTRQGPNRLLYVAIVLSFFLPFATVKGCADEVETTYTGFELIGGQAGAFLTGILLLALLMLGLSFRKRIVTPMRRGCVQAWKALVCALAALGTYVVIGMAHLFDKVTALSGYYVCVASWIALYALAMFTAIRQVVLARRECPEPPPPWGSIVGVVLTGGCLVGLWQGEPPGPAMLVGALLLCLLGYAPLIVLAALAAVHYRIGHPR